MLAHHLGEVIPAPMPVHFASVGHMVDGDGVLKVVGCRQEGSGLTVGVKFYVPDGRGNFRPEGWLFSGVHQRDWDDFRAGKPGCERLSYWITRSHLSPVRVILSFDRVLDRREFKLAA